jgi:hypothetical protein
VRSLIFINSKAKDNTMTTLVLTPSVAAISDELGSITAEIKRLTAQKDKLSAQLKDLGAGTYEGAIYSTLVYYTSPQAVIDWKAIAQKLNPSHQLVTAHTSEKAGFFSAKPTKI